MPQPNLVVFTPRTTSPPRISSIIMKFAVIVSFFAVGLTLVRGGAGKRCTDIPRTLRIIVIPRTVTARFPAGGLSTRSTSCGDGGQVLEHTSIDHNGNSIGFVSGTCPQSGNSANNTKRAAIDERQYICAEGDCEGLPGSPSPGRVA
jgi:hypothetical protein